MALASRLVTLALIAMAGGGWPFEAGAAAASNGAANTITTDGCQLRGVPGAACRRQVPTQNSGTPGPYCPPGDIAATRSACPQNPGGGQGQGHSGGGAGAGAAIGAVAIGTLLCAFFCHNLVHADDPHPEADAPPSGPPPRPPTYQQLVQSGPTLVATHPVNVFALYGVIRPGWPVVISYTSALDGDTVLSIQDGDQAWTQTLAPGTHVATLAFNGAAGSGVGLFTVESVAHTHRGDEARPVDVFALGAGVRAAGAVAATAPLDPAARRQALAELRDAVPFRPSNAHRGQCAAETVAIDDLSFGPPKLDPAHGAASFSYVRETAFEQVVAEVLRYESHPTKTEHGKVWVVDVTPVWRDPAPRQTDRGSSGPRSWPGRDTADRVSPGLHRLQVRGWQITGDQGWVAAVSSDTVSIEGR
jgi:hypothetical protein